MKRNSGKLVFVFLLLALIVINFIAAQWHQRFDLTQEKRYSLTKSTKDLLHNLEEPLTISVFLKGDLPADFRRLSNASEDFVRTLKETNTSKIRYNFISPNDEVENGKTWGDSLKGLGIQPINLSVQVKSGEEIKNAYPVALINYQGQTSAVPLYQGSTRVITPDQLNNAEALMEYNFAKAIDHLVNPQKPLVAYAIGNGEPVGPETYDLVNTIDASKFDQSKQGAYNLVQFNLNSLKLIPDTFKVLLIVKPTQAFTEDEKLKIDQYIMRGGKVLWFVDALHAEQDSLSYKSQLIAYDRNLNIQDLLFRYGVRVNPDLIMDLQCDYLPFAVGGNSQSPQYEFLKWNYYPLFESRGNHAINKNLGLISGKFVNSIDTLETAGLKKTFLLQSSANSRVISTPALISPNENRNATEDQLFKKADIPAAVLVEGKFTSFYKNRIARAIADSLQAYGGFREESEPNKMIVVADGDIVLNQVSSREGPLPMGLNLFTMGSQYEYQFANRNFLLNCLEYLTSNSNLSGTRNKEIVLRLLDPKKVEAERTQWQLINIALPIILIILFGFIYQQIRKRKYTNA
jgi:gliding-associated putative ABC transporter substrate-binding component GldG